MFMHARVARRMVRVAAVLAVGFATAQCGERSTLDPHASPGQARLSIQPVFSRAPGAPIVTLSRVRASLVAANGDSSVTESHFQDGSATLTFEIPIFGGPTEFLLNVSAFDTENVLAYKFSKKITIIPGQTNTVAQPTLEYVAPDAAVTRLVFSPSSLQLNAGGTSEFSVAGMSSSGQSITPLRLAFTSKDPTIATVDPNTGAVTAGLSQGSTFIIAHTVIGVVDSALVKVHAPVDKVILAPASVSIVRGKTTAVAAELRDAGNHLIDDRSATFTSADPTIATVTQTGVITGIAIGKTTITADAEGKTATATVTVTSPVDHIELTPQVIQLASIGESVTLAVKLVPVAGASIDGLTPTFTSSNPAVATVDKNGVVKAVGGGTTTITADVDGVQASTAVTVKQVIVAVSISPRVASVSSIGASQSFAALAVDAQGNPVKDAHVQWSSSDPSIATVDAKGTAVALRAGTTTITATVNDKVDAATFIVAPVVSRLVVVSDKSQIAVGQTATLSARFTDAGGTTLGSAQAVFTNTTPNVVSLNGNVITGLASGTAHITATSGTLTGSVDVRVAPGNGPAVTGRVIDARTTQGIAGVTVTTGNTSATSASDGSFSLTNVPPNATISFAATGYVSTQYFDANSAIAGSAQLGNVPLAPASSANGNVSGNVRDATTGESIDAGTVNIRSGVNNLTGAVVASVGIDEGYFSTLPAGTYTATASSQGFANNSATIVSIGGQSTSNQDISLVPGTGLRITLTWGAEPCDLDSHLFGPTTTGGQFHVWFGGDTGPDGESLDTDETDGFGPENTTVPNPLSTGTYRFYVQRYSSCVSAPPTMASGGATVVVTLNGRIIGTFHPPADAGEQDGAIWAVFSLTGSTITSINTVVPTGCSGEVAPDGTSCSGGEDAIRLQRTIRTPTAITGDVAAIRRGAGTKTPHPRAVRRPSPAAIRKP